MLREEWVKVRAMVRQFVRCISALFFTTVDPMLYKAMNAQASQVLQPGQCVCL